MFSSHFADVGKPRCAVTAGAVADKAGVVNGRRFPTGNGVAGVTGLSGRYVGGQALTRRQGAVVAGRAHGDAGLRVVELDDRFPFAGCLAVAGVAHVAGG